MKTDPENTDYTMEHGASRNYEPWREKAKATNAALADRYAVLHFSSLLVYLAHECQLVMHVLCSNMRQKTNASFNASGAQ